MKSLITPKKSLGQNFLVNPRILDKIVAAAEITKDDTVLEVGPGTGNLTEKLAEKAGRIIAVEKDEKLVELLKNKFTALFAIANIPVFVQGDVLKFRPTAYDLRQSNYKIVANIPYYITSRFLRTVFEKWPKPKLIVLTIQKEVAQRIVASPPHSILSVGASRPKMNPERGREGPQRASASYGMNLLAVSVQFFAEPKIVGYISKENFRPMPKVDSAIIKLTPNPKSYQLSAKSFFKLVRAGFSGKRKMLINNLLKLKIEKERLINLFKNLKISEKSRAENLGLENWINLTNELKLSDEP